MIGGKISTAGFDRLLGKLQINPSQNKVYWQAKELLFLRKQGHRLWFFMPDGQKTVIVSGNVDRKEKTTIVLFEDIQLGFGGYTEMGITKRGEGGSLVEAMGKLKLSENTIGLVAKTKYVDGNAVQLRKYEYSGYLDMDNSRCAFNNSAATVFTRQMPDGARSLVVNNGKDELVLWPNGGWLLYSKADAGIAVGGHEEGLEAAYMKLREYARELVQNKESRLPSEGRDEFGGIALDNSPKSSGTGFFISEDGFLVTNAHVVRNAGQIRLVTSAGLISARVVKVDTANDLALLKVDVIPAPSLGFVLDNGMVTEFSPLPVAASRGMKLGSTVATVGFPNIGLQGFAPKLAKGEIASLSGAGDDARYFQISVPVQPGNSGGALVDMRGNVVGVVSAKLSASAALETSGALPENVNYAVKSSYLLSFLESVPAVAVKLKEPATREKKFEDMVQEAEQAAVLVLVY